MSTTEQKSLQSAEKELQRILKSVPGAIKIDQGRKLNRGTSRDVLRNSTLNKSGSMQHFNSKKHKKLLNTSTSARALAAKKDNMNRTYSLLELAQPAGE